MEPFHWGNDFLTGLPEVDKQHKYLVEIINTFCDFILQNELGLDDVNVIFKELIDYAHYHFKDEEDMFCNAGVDSRHRKEHCDYHKHFLDEIESMQLDISKNGITTENTDKNNYLFKFLTNWLAYHILGCDKNMAKQVKAIESGVSPEDAYEKHEKSDRNKEPLIMALHELFQEVSKRNRELVKLNETLELKVAERTKELYEANCHLEELSITDVLTELPNRRYAMGQLKKLWDQSSKTKEPIACMMIDADGFKKINDSYGHDAGDVVLKVLAKELCNAVRNSDIVCRLGGDEFFVICPNTDQNGVIHVGEMTQQKIDKLRVQAGGGVWRGSVSIGVAARSHNMDNPDALIKAADDGVYAAKQAGKNCVKWVTSS
ncbi:MAG: GGDEF domain-containing protein [Desulfamplus sp.]|nr:GGDEF domain-containing protein [Desulfamplus sp.]